MVIGYLYIVAHAWDLLSCMVFLAASSVWRGNRVIVEQPKGGMWPTHKGGTPLCHSYGIKQGFRLAQTLVYSCCNTADASIHNGKPKT